jgi:diadenosine tetraphosphate (Ap4A) HIT family hydrolase
MTTVFSQIIAGDLPGRFVWQDPEVVAFLSIAPLRPGHTLVVPRQEVDQWQDVDGKLLARCVEVAQAIGRGIRRAWDAPRVGLIVAGFEVPHLHVHVSPVWELTDFDFAKAAFESDPGVLDDVANRLRTALRELGFTTTVPAA